MSNTVYPTAIDSPTDPATTDTLASNPHHTQHGLVNDAVVALETKLGIGSATPSATNPFLIGSGAATSTWVSTLTSPPITTSLLDSNKNTWIGETATASAVNYLNIANAATLNAPTLSVLGTDSNISLNLVPKGSGKVQDNGTNLVDFRNSFLYFVMSGGLWSIGAGFQASMTAITLFINGVEYTAAAVSNHTFAASSDTYVDYTAGTGLTYTAVANNAASPALTANSIRLAIVITSGAAVTSINQGATNVTVPTTSSIIDSVEDSLGNLIFPQNPNSNLLGYRQITGTVTLSASQATPTLITGLTAPVIVPGNYRKIKVTLYAPQMTVAGGTGFLSIWDGTVNVGTQLNGAFLNASGGMNMTIGYTSYAAGGLKTFNAGQNNSGANNTSVVATGTDPAFISVELD